MLKQIIKRDGTITEFDWTKIARAISGAATEVIVSEGKGAVEDVNETRRMAQLVCTAYTTENPGKIPTVEEIQDLVEKVLIKEGHAKTAKAYIVFRHERTRHRDMKNNLMVTMKDLMLTATEDSDLKRENSNIDGNTAMGTMLRLGSEASKAFTNIFVLDPKHANAHKHGDIHIHDLDFYSLTSTCCQIPIKKLFTGGFSTGHGFLREPNDIMTYSALACIAIQSSQNDQHGGQSIPDFDYAMSDGVRKSYRKFFTKNLTKALELICGYNDKKAEAAAQDTMRLLECSTIGSPTIKGYDAEEFKKVAYAFNTDETTAEKLNGFASRHALSETRKATFQAMEALVHNLNTMNSRAGEMYAA